MDDLPLFENFLSIQCGLTVNQSRGETFVFINSFIALLATSDAEIDDIVKITHATKLAYPTNGKILIPTSAIVALKALIFKLEDKALCGALPVLATLEVLEAVQLNYMCAQRTELVADKSNFSALRKLPDITVTKLTANNSS